jgi:hypothetical protein
VQRCQRVLLQDLQRPLHVRGGAAAVRTEIQRLPGIDFTNLRFGPNLKNYTYISKTSSKLIDENKFLRFSDHTTLYL